MQTVQQIVPISDFRIDQNAVLKMIDKEPVILAQRSKARAVLVSIEDWNAMINRINERLFTKAEVEAIVEAYRQRDDDESTITLEEHKARMAERYDHAADKA